LFGGIQYNEVSCIKNGRAEIAENGDVHKIINYAKRRAGVDRLFRGGGQAQVNWYGNRELFRFSISNIDHTLA